ncbi:LuxR family transcriptional regulator [Trinickia terrae]|uniref:LuxR family transcriptional regulator n=1 Tax=Trinickia terrae TaxID=2571161 RepID=A0A4U1IG35_9BURK|nr:autoinducer binding domain-containing protein [Trinickia terrae]TKC92736.1 LuxR family transcriptional regulator [Trinickia terrae]
MELIWQDAFQRFHSAKNEQLLFAEIADFSKQLGFEYCCYGIRVPLPVSKPSVAIFDTYPKGWMKHYQESNYIEIDSTVRAAMSTTGLIVWPDSPPDDSPQLWEDARDFGLAVGVAHSSWAAHGVCGLLTISRSSDLLTPSEINDLTLKTNWLANMAHTLMSRFLVPKLAPEASVVLTPREREVLCWTGEGKTSCEIGQILNISERTVNFHVNNVLLKLSATNKVQAVVKAIAMGLVDSP